MIEIIICKIFLPCENCKQDGGHIVNSVRCHQVTKLEDQDSRCDEAITQIALTEHTYLIFEC